MNKSNLSKIAKSINSAVSKHGSEILIGIGITGMITTTIMAVRVTPKALELIEEEKCERNFNLVREAKENGQDACSQITNLKPADMITTTWKCYIPAAITGGLSIACLIGASSVNVRRNAALATAYTLSESALKEYQEKVIETIGDKKEKSVRDAIAKDKLDKDPVSNREVILTEKGNTLCYDVISGRYFKSDIEKIKKAVNEINKNLLDDMYVSLNDFYFEIGLNNTKIGDDIGWNVEKGLIDISFSSQLADDDNPCLVMNYLVEPKYDYYK